MKTAPTRIHAALDSQISRRALLRSAIVAGVAAPLASACGSWEPFSGAAYAPWKSLEDAISPEARMLGAAVLAASPHNTQPWTFAVAPDRIDVALDSRRTLGPMDPLGRERWVGLGCAIENLAVAARANGLSPAVTLLPDAAASLAARIDLTPAPPAELDLYEQIPRRHTNRFRYLDGPAPPGLASAMQAQLLDPLVMLTVLEEPAQRRDFAQQTLRATRAIVDDTPMHRASDAWYRHTLKEITEHRDGLTLDAIGLDPTLRRLGTGGARPDLQRAGDYWIRGTRDLHSTGWAFCILSTPDRGDARSQMRAGRAFQRLALWASGVGLSVHPLNQVAERQDREEELGLEPDFGPVLTSWIGDTALGGQMLFRIGVAFDDAGPSPRRPVEWVTR